MQVFRFAQGSAAEQAAAARTARSTSGAAADANSQPAVVVGARADACLLASKGRWRELLDAMDAAGDGAGEYVRQADHSGYTALHRSVRRTMGLRDEEGEINRPRWIV